MNLQVKPTHVLNAAGLTGRPNVDWCEDHKVCLEHPTLIGLPIKSLQLQFGQAWPPRLSSAVLKLAVQLHFFQKLM